MRRRNKLTKLLNCWSTFACWIPRHLKLLYSAFWNLILSYFAFPRLRFLPAKQIETQIARRKMYSLLPYFVITKNNLKKKNNKIEQWRRKSRIFVSNISNWKKFCLFRIIEKLAKIEKNVCSSSSFLSEWNFRWNNLEILVNMLENSRSRSSLLFKQTAIRNYKLSGNYTRSDHFKLATIWNAEQI